MSRRGFTLLELMVVLVIVGILSGVFLAAGGSVFRRTAEKLTKVRLQQIAGMLEEHRTIEGEYPDDRLTSNASLTRINDGPEALFLALFDSGYTGGRPNQDWLGNSDGDREMLEWTAAGPAKAPLMMLVEHDDATREYAYGPADGLPDSPFGHLSQSTVDEANKSGWTVISMKNDWAEIFPPATE